MTYIVTYYDIEWNIHNYHTPAESVADAIQKTMTATRCTFNEIITVYPPEEQ